MRIALLDPFFDESHRHWAMGLKKHSHHQIDIFHMPPVHWKWKMTGGSIHIADQINKEAKPYDLLLVTDMLNVPLFLSRLNPILRDTPLVLYMHENQITYPWSAQDRDILKNRDYHYGFINFSSCLVADGVVFNSKFHRREFLNALPVFLRKFPDFRFSVQIDDIQEKSTVLPIGMEMADLTRSDKKEGGPVFLWNHRWEHDKNPETFFNSLIELKVENVDFGLIVLGKSFDVNPPIFEKANKHLNDRIIHWGFAPKDRYYELLRMANIALITSYQDFFGISVVEAIASGCLPVIPGRLSYSEHIPPDKIGDVTYYSDDEIVPLLERIIRNEEYSETVVFQDFVRKYSWDQIIPLYDDYFKTIREGACA